ncbi:hypothetical protein LBMAG18_00340 [Alphaproteobacteria bacterium]|nr:hypothetical protein LBMAG18_00340 [Alphaproteobacteria bacterium]
MTIIKIKKILTSKFFLSKTKFFFKLLLVDRLSYFFALSFIVTTFTIACKDSAISQSENLKVKSHLNFSEKFSGKAYVLDGDSVRVSGKEVRLFGIDAPEYSQTCFNKKNIKYYCGLNSKEFLIKLIGGKKVDCLYAQKDKYDRFLAKCYLDNLSINEEIIKNGMAVVYNFTESDEKIDKLEEQAKNKKIGIWQGAFELPKNYRKKNPNLHKK